ncbi:MAG: LCP family protein [Oscillospiraceae bacterium]
MRDDADNRGRQNNRQGRPQLFDQDLQPGAAAQRSRPPVSGGRVPARPLPPPRQQSRPAPYRAAAQPGAAPLRRPAPAGQGAPPPQSRRAYAAPAKGPVKRRKTSKGRGAVALLMALVLLVAGGFTLYNIYQNRMDGTQTDAGVLPEEGKTLPEFQGDHVSFLVCGIDYDNEGASGYTSEAKVGRTDMVLYVYYNVAAGKASILQIPRDTFVGDAVNTGGTGKMNGLYYFAEDKNNRMSALSTVFNDQFKLPVDFYLTLDLDAVKALVDVKGSIEVYVPMDIDDEGNGTTSKIEAGWRSLNSTQLEFFLRARKSSTYNEQGDIARLRMQQSFYSALYREFTQLTPSDLMMWMNSLTYYCKSDLGLTDLSGIALKALNLKGSDITFVRPPCGAVTHNGVSLISLVGDETAEILNTYFRPEGQSYTLAELNLQTLPIPESMGVAAAEIKTMGDIQATEPAKTA